MNIDIFLRSVIEQDSAPVVLCDLRHTVVYMNRAAAQRYSYAGGAELIGKSLMNCHNAHSRGLIEKCIAWFEEDVTHNSVYESYNPDENKDVYIVALRDADGKLIGYYEKHEYRNKETDRTYGFMPEK